ncbi:MAG: DUF2721 domain-containing protein [Pseudomonadota bacterium]
MDIQLGDVGHIIQLSIAPVFLLAGVCTKLMVLTNRLARIIDRSRVLEDRLHEPDNVRRLPEDLSELAVLYQRSHLINRAITLSTACGLFVCVVICALFVGDAFNLQLGKWIAAFFVMGMLSLIGSFVYLLREIFIATASLSNRVAPPPR